MAKEKSREKEHLTVHHIVGRCNSSWADVHDKTNRMILSEFKHRSFNNIFEQAQSPQEQLAVMYNQFRKKTLSKQVCDEIEKLLSMTKEEFYSKKIIKKKK